MRPIPQLQLNDQMQPIHPRNSVRMHVRLMVSTGSVRISHAQLNLLLRDLTIRGKMTASVTPLPRLGRLPLSSSGESGIPNNAFGAWGSCSGVAILVTLKLQYQALHDRYIVFAAPRDEQIVLERMVCLKISSEVDAVAP